MSHNYGEPVADAIANNGGSLDVILHDAAHTDGDGTPRPTFFSFDRQAADFPDCRLRPPDLNGMEARPCRRRSSSVLGTDSRPAAFS